MKVECNPKRFNSICVTSTPSFDTESIFFVPSTKCFVALRVSAWCEGRLWFFEPAKLSLIQYEQGLEKTAPFLLVMFLVVPTSSHSSCCRQVSLYAVGSGVQCVMIMAVIWSWKA